MTAAGRRTKGRRAYQKHGLSRLKRAVSEAGARGLQLDRRTKIGRSLAAFRVELVEDYGGLEAVSARQRGLVDVAVSLKLLIDSGTAWVLAQTTVVNARKRAFIPIVGELASLLSRYQSVMRDLGLAVKPKPIRSPWEEEDDDDEPPPPPPVPQAAAATETETSISIQDSGPAPEPTPDEGRS